MAYVVKGGHGEPVVGVIDPADFDGRAEWVRLPRSRSFLDLVEARLGSEDDVRKVLLAVLAPLRSALDGEPLGAILRHLPGPLALEIVDADLNLGAAVRSPTGGGDYLSEVSRLVLHPPGRAATYVRAVFAAAHAVLDANEADAIAARLPPDVAEIWRTAR